jgi:predicted Zn finger-like uncharacterized protein
MKRKTECPNCASTFNVPEEYAGKRAKCAKCNQSFVVAFSTERLDEVDWTQSERPEPAPPTIHTSSFTTASALTNQTVHNQIMDVPKQKPFVNTIKIAGLTFAALVLGFFLGREHFKYQMRSAMSNFSSALVNATSTVEKQTPAIPPSERTNAPESKPVSAPPVQPVETQKLLPATPPTILPIGKPHRTDRFLITLLSASIEKAKIKDFMGDEGTGKEPDLVLKFSISNVDERRILRFDEGNQFMASHFRMRDDVDNVIRRVNYGFGHTVVGALTENEDITPGMTVNHVELFSTPPPKTEFLILTIDLKCVGGEGSIQYRIPADQIRR